MTYSRSCPSTTGRFAVAGRTLHANAFWLAQSHTASLGVGGRVLLASHVEFWVGHAIVADAGADERVGVLGGEVALYWVERRVKSADVLTLITSAELPKVCKSTHVAPFAPEKVTIP